MGRLPQLLFFLFIAQSFGFSDHLRPTYHFLAPEGGWLNDPNGPMFFGGYYHLFWQKGGESEAIWGDIRWGHAVTKDFVNWKMLKDALVPGPEEYDKDGCWSGSASLTPTSYLGPVTLLYTGVASNPAATYPWNQSQVLAIPTDPSDPFLESWEKWEGNPILEGPPFPDSLGFRDPTTVWQTEEGGKYYMGIGSGVPDVGGTVLLYSTEREDLSGWDFDGFLAMGNVSETGVEDWECPDFYPFSLLVDNSDKSKTKDETNTTWVLKTSADHLFYDQYALGTYHPTLGTFVPFSSYSPPRKLDFGDVYASKSFWDQEKNRRVMWSWLPEKDSQEYQIQRGWAGIQALPREVRGEGEGEGGRLLFFPVPELEKLRTNTKPYQVGGEGGEEGEGQRQPLALWSEQLELIMTVDEEQTTATAWGLEVLGDSKNQEFTRVLVRRNEGGGWGSVEVDREKSSLEVGADRGVLRGEFGRDGKGEVRVFVDHSVVEVFADGGGTVVTGRVYPTLQEGGVSVYWEGGALVATVTTHEMNPLQFQ